MKTKRFLGALILSCLLPITAMADIYQDPVTKVNYKYTVGSSEASVKAGYTEFDYERWDQLYYPGSPDAKGDVDILSSFTVDGIEYTVTSIEYSAFFGCRSLTSVKIPDGVTRIGYMAFYDCSGLTSVTIGNGVMSIDSDTFSGCSGLTSVTIGNGVMSINDRAFYGCSGLTSISIPNSVTSIASDAFYYTGWYKNQPDGILYLDNWLLGYKGDKPTGELVITEGTRGIAGGAFSGCSGLTSITIPNSVENIGGGAFTNTGWYMDQPDGILYLDNWLLGNKGGEPTGELVIKEGTKGFANSALSRCSGLTSIIIPNSVKNIGSNAFYHSGLTSVTIGNGVKSIGSDAFEYNYDLTSVHISDIAAWCTINFCTHRSNPFFFANNLYLGEEKVTNLVIPNSVTRIGDYAFEGCRGLTSVAIPESVTTIGYESFANCSGLTSITIPSSVTTIGNYAFYGCTGMTSVTSLIAEPFEIDERVFSYYDYPSIKFNTAVLFVPKGTKEKYLSTPAWNKFQTILEIGEVVQLKGDVNGDMTIDVADIASVIDVMAGSADVSSASADVNGDGTVDVADIAAIIDEMAASARRQGAEE